MRILSAIILATFALCSFALPCQAEDVRTIIILDATAQMSAALGQKRKLDWAKTGISGAVSRMEPASSFALWAFGALPQKKCEDIGELVPLQPAGGALGTLDKALSALQPKAARAPAMDALQAALKGAAPSEAKPVSAIVVSGTGDDCIGDICGAAGRLHGLYPNAKLTVLGLNMSEQAAANFTCAARAMDGAFTAVKTGAELERSLREALGAAKNAGQPRAAVAAPVNAASAGTDSKTPEQPAAAPPSPPPPTDQPVQKEAEEKAALPPQPEPNVVLSATLISGMPPLESGVTWEIYKIQITPTGQARLAEAPLWIGGGAQAKAKLPEGRYGVRLAYGLATATGEFTLGAEKVEKTIPLDAGTIVAEAQQAPNSPPAGDAFFVVSQMTSAGREELGRSSGAPALFHLNAGGYTLSVFAGAATLEAPVKVVAGKVSVVRMPLNVGALEIKTFAKEGSPELVAAWHRVSPAATSDQKSVMRVSGSSIRFQLPAGSYRLETIYGNAREESVVTVNAGQLTSKNVVMNAGEAKLSLAPGKSDSVCAVYEAGSNRTLGPVGRAAGSDIRFILKAGRYDVECREKGDTAPPKQAQITVVAGEVQSAKMQE